MGWVGVLSVPRAPPKPRSPLHGAPWLAGGRGPGPGRLEENPRGGRGPSRRRVCKRVQTAGDRAGREAEAAGPGEAQRAGDAPWGPGLPCPLSPSPPPRGHPRRPPPLSSGETKAAPPEDPGFPALSYICLDGPGARDPQPLGARRRRSPGPAPPARALCPGPRPLPGPSLPAGPCAPLRVRAPPSHPSAPRAPLRAPDGAGAALPPGSAGS